MDVLQDGGISGLNGVLLGVAAESSLPGTCLLGEMPHIFAQVPYPKASLAVLRTFRTLTGLEIDLGEMESQAEAMQKNLRLLMSRIEDAIGSGESEEEPSSDQPPEPEDTGAATLDPDVEQHLEDLFARAAHDRSQAYRLKQELDRLDMFEKYEDRFLDLFKDSGAGDDDGNREESAA